MRIEILLICITGFLVTHIYTEGRLIKRVLAAKKYLQIVGVIVGALFVYYLIKFNPMRAKDILQTSHEYVKYLPVDRSTTDFLSPILDFTARSMPSSSSSSSTPSTSLAFSNAPTSRQQQRMLHSGKHGTKRSVSETKKKFVASRQNWHCGHCHKQLSAWFEVDHIRRLEHGGSNHIDNLIALCRECHGEKTAIENL